MEWISIKHKLPNHAEKVMVSHLTSNGRDEAMGTYHVKDGWFYFDGIFDYNIEVTHWMPLPEPPKTH